MTYEVLCQAGKEVRYGYPPYRLRLLPHRSSFMHVFLTPVNTHAGPLKDAFDIIVTIYDLYRQSQVDEANRLNEKNRSTTPEWEGVLHVYSGWAGETTFWLRRYYKTGLLAKYPDGVTVQMQGHYDRYDDFEPGVLSFSFLKPGEDMGVI